MEIPNRGQLETTLAKRLSRVASVRRQQIADELGYPPDPSRVSESIWIEFQRDAEEELAVLLYLIFLSAAYFHAFGSVTGPKKNRGGVRKTTTLEDELEGRARGYSQDRAAQAAAGMADSARQRFRTLARDIEAAQQSGDGGGPPMTRGELSGRLIRILGPDAVEVTAVTETTKAQSEGAEKGIESVDRDGPTGKDERDLWITEDDKRVCPICEPLHEKPRRVWGAQYPTGPPAHPRCRCTVLYINQLGGGQRESVVRRFTRWARGRHGSRRR